MKGISGSKHGLASLCCSLMLILVLLIVQLVFAIDLDIDDPGQFHNILCSSSIPDRVETL